MSQPVSLMQKNETYISITFEEPPKKRRKINSSDFFSPTNAIIK